MTAKPWLPAPSATLKWGELNDNSSVWYWKKTNAPDAVLTVLVVDDMNNEVINVSKAVALGSDAFAVREAVKALINSPQVSEVLIGGFYDAVRCLVSQERKESINGKRLCVLLDVLLKTDEGIEEERPGVPFAQSLSDWDLPTENLAQFSKEGSQEIMELGFPTVIPKPQKAAVLEMYDTMKLAIAEWVVDCAKPLLSPFKKNVGHDILDQLSDVINNEFHNKFPDCHDLELCLANDRVCRKRLASLDNSVLQLAYRTALAKVGMLSGEMLAKLFWPLVAPQKFNNGIPFALCKTLSEYGPKSGRWVPGWWLAEVFGVSGEVVGLCEFEIPNSTLQPMSGFLQACHTLKRHPSWSAAATSQEDQIRIDVAIKSKDAQGGVAGLESLRKLLAAMFSDGRRPIGGDTTRLFQALVDGGVQVGDLTLAGEELTMCLTLPLTRVR